MQIRIGINDGSVRVAVKIPVDVFAAAKGEHERQKCQWALHIPGLNLSSRRANPSRPSKAVPLKALCPVFSPNWLCSGHGLNLQGKAACGDAELSDTSPPVQMSYPLAEPNGNARQLPGPQHRQPSAGVGSVWAWLIVVKEARGVPARNGRCPWRTASAVEPQDAAILRGNPARPLAQAHRLVEQGNFRLQIAAAKCTPTAPQSR